MAGSHNERSSDLHIGSISCFLDSPCVGGIVVDRVIEEANLRVLSFVGLPRQLTTANQLGIGWRFRLGRNAGGGRRRRFFLEVVASNYERQPHEVNGYQNRAEEENDGVGKDFDPESRLP